MTLDDFLSTVHSGLLVRINDRKNNIHIEGYIKDGILQTDEYCKIKKEMFGNFKIDVRTEDGVNVVIITDDYC